ncbi:sodium/glutamate symporter [Hathewaya limosa]|uniref:Sodium/glutamate symporter n=1 Tax=Hathewaya limosa TaxID=1536 RepID=A0ABU0JN78_HATLI|nr:sodium/glutamate symporter [Hathewaya limosa]MDQ0478536.1 ESS family glutamate:Na+ symporter [Hathewaya limosa]
MEIKLDMMQTTALAVVMYYFGVWCKSKLKFLEKFCIPAPVVGGLIFSILHLILRQTNVLTFVFDNTLQKPFMMVFFTTIGLGASIQLIKKGGMQVITFWLISLLLCILQNTLGIFLAKLTHQSALVGLLAGSITMTGGHGTAGAFGPEFEQIGVMGATTLAMAAATFGLVMGSLMGGPLGEKLIVNRGLKSNASEYEDSQITIAEKKEEVSYSELFKTLTLIFVSIGLGGILEFLFKKIHFTLPSYVNAMFVAAVILNLGESTGKWHINQKCSNILGNIALNIFLSLALITLELWQLAAVAGPLLVILLGQTLLMALFARFITFNLLGKDFDAAVLSAGHCGFGMGATANGIANMDAIKEKFGPAPRAYFVLPIVGAFLIDITNTFVITLFVNLIKHLKL